jgi:hypothetical protein
MADDARAIADGMRDHEGTRIMLGLAAWAAKAEMADTDGLD